MDELKRLQQGLASEPGDDTGWLALADCLEERGDADRAELVRVQLWVRRRLDDGQFPAWERQLRRLWTERVAMCQPTFQGPHGIEFVLIPPGEFWMGAQDGEAWHNADELPRHRVRLTRGFWMSRTPITQAQWRGVMGSNPSHRQEGDRPVESVNCHEALRFCERLTALDGRTARLPSEAEWEYACRAGTQTPYCSGEGLEALKLVGWCSYDGTWDGAGGTRRVGQFRPNSWGLFDMHGNVWEWCSDWLGYDAYRTSPLDDPTGPATGQQRVIRGGSWRGGPWFCRSAERWGMSPNVGEINLGLRVVMEL
jgi:uncharacterized protein (TIGR02996 family)